MKVKFIATIIADIKVFPDDVLNSDSVGDYKAELDCELGNSALTYLSDHLKNFEYINIDMAEPEYYEGIEEYGNLLNNWQKEYNERMSKRSDK